MPRWLSQCSHSGIQIDRIHISTLGSFWYLAVCHNTPTVLKGSREKTRIVPKEPGNAVQASNHSTQDAESQS